MKLFAAVALIVGLTGVGAADPLKVDVLPAFTTFYPGKPVEVTLRVTNVSAVKQKFAVFNCSWDDSWKSSDPDLMWERWGCDKNAPMTIELLPKGERTWTLSMFATTGAKTGPHALVMTFTPDKGTPTASAPVTITVGGAGAGAVPPAPPPLVVEVVPQKTTWAAGETVPTLVRVTNKSKTVQTIKVWSCSWSDQWKADDAAFTWSSPTCRKNGVQTLTLPPRGIKQWTLAITAAASATIGAHEVRLTFSSDGGDAIASDPLTLTIKK